MFTSEKRLDDLLKSIPRIKKPKTCGLCHGIGHHQPQCLKILAYGNGVLPLGKKELRQRLVQRLYNSNERVEKRDINDTRVIMRSVPTSVKGAIIHRRLLINANLNDANVIDNYAIECTFIIDGGREHSIHRKTLFSLPCIAGFLFASVATRHVNSQF